MMNLQICPLGADREPELVALWHSCGLVVPHNPPLADIAFAQSSLNAEVLVGNVGDRIVASVMVGHDGHRGWLYYVAIAPDQQGAGFGATIVAAGEEWLRSRSVRKVQLMVRPGNTGVLSFYEHIGYETSPITVMQRWL